MPQETINPGENNLNAWGQALNDIHPGLGDIYDEDRMFGIGDLDRFDLPRYKRLSLPLTDFLKTPESYIKSLESSDLYVSLNPHNKKLPRQRRVMAVADVVPFIAEHAGSNPDQFDILFLQYFDNLYGGNIVVSADNYMIIEFRKGYQGPIANGSETPQFRAARDIFTGHFSYSFEDRDLREMIYRTVQTIPHQPEKEGIIYLPGYYEFVIVRNPITRELEPKFIDLKRSLAELFQRIDVFAVASDHSVFPLVEQVRASVEKNWPETFNLPAASSSIPRPDGVCSDHQTRR